MDPNELTERLVLASASPRRRELLGALGCDFSVAPTDVDETLEPGASVEQAVERLAIAKASAAAHQYANAIVIAADTLVSLDGVPLGKPSDAGQARGMLLALAGRTHEVLTGIAVVGTQDPTRTGNMPVPRTRVVRTSVTMRQYSEADVERSIRRGTPFDKAGGYGIQDGHFVPVAGICGCHCNVLGLPLLPAYELLTWAGMSELRTPDIALETCRACPLRPTDEATIIELPSNALIILCGAAGSGKSTFAAQHFEADQVISSDRLRGQITGDEADQTANSVAFHILARMVRQRLGSGLLTVIDTTAARARDRRSLKRLARPFGVPVIAVVFDASLETCLERNRARPRQVPEQVIARQHARIKGALQCIPSEGYDAVYVLEGETAAEVRASKSAGG